MKGFLATVAAFFFLATGSALAAPAAVGKVIEEIRRPSPDHTVIIYKDYTRRPGPRARKKAVPAFREYDVRPKGPVVPVRPVPASYPTADPPRSYSQTYAPGPTRAMAAGGAIAPATTTYMTSYPACGFLGTPFFGSGNPAFFPQGPVVINNQQFPFQRIDPFVSFLPRAGFTGPRTFRVPTVVATVRGGGIVITVP